MFFLLAALVPAVPAAAHTRDRDHDGLRNAFERLAKTDPRDADTDEDGRRDGREDPDRDGLTNRQEQRFGHHPRDRDDDDDGVRDGRERAGTIVSFTGGVLTIRLANGDEVRGRVDGRTEIECEDDRDDDRFRTLSGGDDGDSSGSGSSGSGSSGSGSSGSGSSGSGSSGSNSGPGSGDDDDRPVAPAPSGSSGPSGHDDDDDDERCGTEVLRPGAIVHEAELRLDGSGAWFDEVEVLR